MIKKTILLIGFILTVIAAIQGCGEGSEPLLSSTLKDDGIPPHSPSWRDTPYTIEKLYEEHYKVTLQWNKVTTNRDNNPKGNVAGYKILKADANGNLVSTFMTPIQPGSSYEFFVDANPNLKEGTSYSYRLMAFDTYFRESTTSGPQLINIVTLSADKPKAVTGLRFETQMNGNVTMVYLFWDPVKEYEDGASVSNNLLGYEIYRADGSVRPTIPLAIVTPENVSYVDTGITDRTKTYRYWIRAVDNKGSKSSYSSPMAVSFLNIENPSTGNDYDDAINVPGAPHITKVKMLTLADGSTEWSVEWEAPVQNSDGTTCDDLSVFKIYRSDSINGIYTVVGITASRKFVYTTPSTKSYYYRISALDDSVPPNEGAWSGAGYDGIDSGGNTFLPDINGPDTAGRQLNFALNPTATTTSGIGLQWYDMGTGTEIDRYNVYRSLFPEGPYAKIGSVTDINRPQSDAYTYTDTRNIIQDKRYYYRLTGENVAGESGLSYYVTSRVIQQGTKTYEAEDINVDGTQSEPDLVLAPGRPFVSNAPMGDGSGIIYAPITRNSTTAPTSQNNYLMMRGSPLEFSGTYEVEVRYLDDLTSGDYTLFIQPCRHIILLGSDGTPDYDVRNVIGQVTLDHPTNPPTGNMITKKVTVSVASNFVDETDDYVWFRLQYTGQPGYSTDASYEGYLKLDYIKFTKK